MMDQPMIEQAQIIAQQQATEEMGRQLGNAVAQLKYLEIKLEQEKAENIRSMEFLREKLKARDIDLEELIAEPQEDPESSESAPDAPDRTEPDEVEQPPTEDGDDATATS